MNVRRMFMTLTVITAAVAAVVGGMPAAGWSQTTSSSSSTSTSSTSTSSPSTTSSSTTSTTATTAPEPCLTLGGCPSDPPAGFLRGAAGERPGVRGGFCWRQPPGSGPPGSTLCTSVLLVQPFPYERLVVSAGEQLTLRFDPSLRPQGVTISRSTEYLGPEVESFDTSAASPTTFRADFPVGDHYLTATVRFAQGAVPYTFAVTVRRGPAPTPGPVRFTG